MNHRVSLVLGTRPEAIKLAPVILALQVAGDFSTQARLWNGRLAMVDLFVAILVIVAPRLA